jgi:hypothetical protein
VPYALFRPLVHALHLVAVWRSLGDGRDDPVVVHDCATRSWLRRLMVRRARGSGRPVFLVLLDVEAEVARSGQRARDRRVRGRVMRRHERRWRALTAGAVHGRLPEGYAGVRVLDRPAADAVAAMRFPGPVRQDPPVGSRWEDDDDWVGTPPEGRHSRDRAKPEFWWRQRPIVPAAVAIAVVVLVIVVVALLD